MVTLNKKLYAALTVFVTLTALLVTGLWVSSAHAQPSSLAIQTTATATTSPSFITAGTASTTYQFDNAVFSSGKVANVQGIDAVSLYVQFAASSTATAYQITPQFSNNGVDWYGYGAIGSTNVATSSMTIYYTPGTTATTSQVFSLPAVPANHERVVVGTSGANGAVYMEVDLKKNPSTP